MDQESGVSSPFTTPLHARFFATWRSLRMTTCWADWKPGKDLAYTASD